MFKKVNTKMPNDPQYIGLTEFMRTLEIEDRFECNCAGVYQIAKQIGIKVRRRTVDGVVIVQRIG